MRRAFVAVTLAVGVLLPAAPAAASCSEDSGPDGSAVVFVGTAEAERRGYTRFAVEEVWAGPDLAPEIWVRSGQDQPTWPLSYLSAVGSSVDAEFVARDRYVVGASRSFATSACSVSWDEVGPSPADARTPVDDGETGADPPIGPWGQTLVVAGVLGLVLGLLVALRRVRRRPTPSGTTSSPP